MSSPTVPFMALISPVPATPPDGGGEQPPTDAKPEHPIVIPPDGLAPGVPSHPIYIPVYPAHPIVIPPGSIGPPPNYPAHPIVLPPYPAHPIVIPPDSVAPGVPAHPIYFPPYPAHPIELPDPPPDFPPPGNASDNWEWGWSYKDGWHPVYVTGDKPSPVPPPS